MLSLIIPVFNEEDNLKALHAECVQVLHDMQCGYEIIYVDDGSRDKSLEILKELAKEREVIKVISFVKNFGQTAALAAGIAEAKGDILVFSDSDLQNDPRDIPLLVKKIDEGFDVVSGWRKERKDKMLSRKIPSWIANTLISRITGIALHDYGCTLKAYRRRVIEGVNLFGEMHRFIPAYASWYGAKVTEVVVHHRPRIHGVSKYGIGRTLRVVLDLLFVKFWSSFRAKPMHFFGGIGAALLGLSIVVGIFTLYLKIFEGRSFIATPLPLLIVFLFVAALQFILIGIVAEMLTRIYFEQSTNPRLSYSVKEKINIP